MASVFRKDDNYVEKPNRNAFPKTYESHLTTKFGQIIPAFCKPVMIGETVKIDPQMNFNFLPLVFPIQNRVRASLSFYYVRNRNLWKDWMDFQFKMKDGLVPPYHVFREETYRELLRVGGLLDHLGVPVVLHGHYPVKMAYPDVKYSGADGWWYDAITGTYEKRNVFQSLSGNEDSSGTEGGYPYVITDWENAFNSSGDSADAVSVRLYQSPIKVLNNSVNFIYENIRGDLQLIVNRYVSGEKVVDRTTTSSDSADRVTGRANNRVGIEGTRRIGQSGAASRVDKRVATSSSVSVSSEMVIATSLLSISSLPQGTTGNVSIQLPGDVFEIIGYVVPADNPNINKISLGVIVDEQFGEFGVPLSSLTLDSLPFPYIQEQELIDSDDRLHISSMPARAITTIYNAFVRNETNNPFMVNGQPEYNKYLPNVEGGADADFYPIYKRNWQDDCFTTALHSPQHGVAPLVGLSYNDTSGVSPVAVFEDSDGVKYRYALQVDSEGIVTSSQYEGPTDVDMNYVNILSNALMDGITNFGMSINDFRNVNSYQRWLENNVRKGYKYPDQIKAHTGVSVKYNILDMPEYIGGMSRDMNVNTVVQTTENDYGNLGDFSGQAWIEGNMEHSIEHFCDEEGFIIGLLSVDPVAPYSQVIPKYLLRENAFDYYSHEFGKIGMQPILNREIAPLQSFYEGNSHEVFGYQRAWYDSLDGLSEVHGKFRTDFRNFIINRTFETVPQLGEDFLTMSDNDINNVFYVDDGEDKILGQILFRYESIMPIPMYGIPALE